MSHALCYAVVPTVSEEGLKAVMKPHLQQDDEKTLTRILDQSQDRPVDWYIVGGRFTGEFPDNANYMTVKALLPLIKRGGCYPWSIATPNGQWHERARLLMFGRSTKERPLQNWLKEVRQVLHQYPEYWVILVDFHQ